MMYEGENVNTIDLLYETNTEECNGVKVIIPVKYGDRSSFVNKIKEQLAYFQNVYFDVPLGEIKNNFKIIRHDLFQYSELSSDGNLHLCLDDVYYPLDFSKLGIDPIRVDVAIRCSLTDGIFPVPNREQLVYNVDSKKIILSKIKNLSDYLITKYNESVAETEDVEKIIDYYSNDSKYYQIENKIIDINKFKKHSDVDFIIPKLKSVELLDLERINKYKNYIFADYLQKYILYNRKIKENKYDRGVNYSDRIKVIYLCNGFVSNKIKEYIKSLHSEALFARQSYKYKLGISVKEKGDYNANSKYYYSLLNLKSFPKNQWRQVINEFLLIKNYYTNKFIDVNSIVIPKEFKESRKKQRIAITKNRVIKFSGEITLNVGRDLLRDVQGKNCKFEPQQYKINALHKIPSLVIYGDKEQEGKLQKLYPLIKNKLIVIISEKELKKLEGIKLHNFISIDKFMEGKNKAFKRIVTSYLINQLRSNNINVFYQMNQLKFISTDLMNKLKILDNYKSKWYIHSSDTIYEAMLEIAKDQNLFDEEIYSLYKECKFVLNKLPFINTLMNNVSSYNTNENEPYLCIIRDMCKYYKFRINWKNYSLPLNEEKVEILTEETINELV